MRTSTAVKIKSYRSTYRGATVVIAKRKKIQRIKSAVFSVFKLATLLSIFYFIVVGGYEGYKYVMASPYFDISDITIDGNINLKRDDILSSANIKIGQNIFSVSIEDVYKRLKGSPWIKDASVKKEMPDRLKIEINERKPAAVLKSNELYLIDGEGVVLAKLNGESDRGFPVIVKPMDLKYEIGDRVNSEDVFIGINIWGRLQGVELYHGGLSFKESITTIEPLSSDKAKINLRNTNTYIVISDEDFDKKFQHLQVVMNSLNENAPLLKGKNTEEVMELDYIDLSFRDKVIVKYKHDYTDFENRLHRF